jgi:hypothetical protein
MRRPTILSLSLKLVFHDCSSTVCQGVTGPGNEPQILFALHLYSYSLPLSQLSPLVIAKLQKSYCIYKSEKFYGISLPRACTMKLFTTVIYEFS